MSASKATIAPGSAVRDPLADHLVAPQNGMTATDASVGGRRARAFLRKADPVLGRINDAHPDFRPRAWLDELPLVDAFGTLIFQGAGQQLSVRATRTIVSWSTSEDGFRHGRTARCRSPRAAR